MQRKGRLDMRLDSTDEIATNDFEVFDSVFLPTTHEKFQFSHLRLVLGDDQLSTLAMRDLVPLAKVIKQVTPTNTMKCFERTGDVVDPGVNDAAIPSRGT